ncbi:hypothetical protein HPB49_014819 [Dermacentor silvarum]|uniref:Uncharacterized protein n=1 Tax=Dermacentor silvarum TaxID=543639 RepID=A0ACB8D5V5_DERSI|nr:hypothetical protein HPB49_014819 [Dermacentor silvarum]
MRNGPETVVDATASIVGLSEVGGLNFQVTVKSMASMTLIVDAGCLVIGGERCQVVPVVPQVTNVTCLFLPSFVSNEALVQALSPYGKVLSVNADLMSGRHGVLTGTCFVRMEMSTTTPVPNYLRVSGHRVTFEYHGLQRVCRRCGSSDHYRAPQRSVAVVAFMATKAKDATVLVGVAGMVALRPCALCGAHTRTLLLEPFPPYRRRQLRSQQRVTPRHRINQRRQLTKTKQAARTIATRHKEHCSRMIALQHDSFQDLRIGGRLPNAAALSRQRDAWWCLSVRTIAAHSEEFAEISLDLSLSLSLFYYFSFATLFRGSAFKPAVLRSLLLFPLYTITLLLPANGLRNSVIAASQLKRVVLASMLRGYVVDEGDSERVVEQTSSPSTPVPERRRRLKL